jgi:hypothetical protein
MTPLTAGGYVLLIIVGVLAVLALLADHRRILERERIRQLEAETERLKADAKLREAKYIALLRDKVLVERELADVTGQLEALRLMLGDTTRRLFQIGRAHV